MIKKLTLSLISLALALTVIVLIGIDVFTPYVDPMNTDRYQSYREWKPHFSYTARLQNNTADAFAHYKESDTALTVKAKYYALGGVTNESAVLEARYDNSFFGGSSPSKTVILHHPDLTSDALTAMLQVQELTVTIKQTPKTLTTITIPADLALSKIWEPLQKESMTHDASGSQITYNNATYTLTAILKLGANGLIEVPLSIYSLSDVWFCSLADAGHEGYCYQIFLDDSVKTLITDTLAQLSKQQ